MPTLGTLGNNARASGAALLPFRASFSAYEVAFSISLGASGNLICKN